MDQKSDKLSCCCWYYLRYVIRISISATLDYDSHYDHYVICAWGYSLIGYAIASYQPPSKSQIASVIKNVIDFDFGDDFKLLKTSSHDYEEYLYIFSESSFEPLKNHLESIPDKEGQDGERSISHLIDGKAGFYLSDNRLKDGCGNIEAI